ncbi:MAG: efflux RND transporter permease subunit [Proteobacteria bacterium]|nr:efflux RND transporter permease subunit [Pseudomonadota bacterium]
MTHTAYFIKHPVIAFVLNALIFIIGALSFFSIPLREYPNVQVVTLVVRSSYPNASAELIESSVTNFLEDELSGIQGIDILKSSSSEGVSFVELTFLPGTEMNQALVDVQGALGRVKSMLPKEVHEPNVERKGKSDGMPFMVLSLASSTMDFGALTHYAELNLKNAFRSLKGVSSALVWGQPYTYKIVLDPQKMYDFGVNADDIYEALEKSKLSLPVGKFQNKIPTTLNVKLSSIEDYENLVVKEQKEGGEESSTKSPPIFLKSVSRISLETDSTINRVRINGEAGLVLAITRTSDSNPLDVSKLVHEKVKELEKTLPKGVKIKIVEDQAEFIRASLDNIRSSLLEACLFVLGIVFLFLGNVRSTFIPLITIPISLAGSFIFLKMFGFSINLMTLLAMVLAVGLVVDDAIVVLENITRHLEEGFSSIDAALIGAKEIGFAIMAMTLTLTSVYAPIAFIQGAIGQLFVEFAVALAGSVLISGCVALTLSPMMCSKILKNHPKHIWPFIEGKLSNLTISYERALTYVLNNRFLMGIFSAFAIGATIFFYCLIPQEVVPKEDRCFIGVYVPPIAGKNIDTMDQKLKEIEKIVSALPEVQENLIFIGNWGGNICLPLRPKSERKRSAEEIINSIRPQLAAFPSIDVWPWSWDSGLPGMDNALSGGQIDLVISTVESYQDLFKKIENIKKIIDDQKMFKGAHHDLKLNFLGMLIDLDINEIAKLNIKPKQIGKMIEVFFSGDRSLTFQKDGILYPITLEGPSYPWTLDELYITNDSGKRISLGSLATVRFKAQPKELIHYNQMRATTLSAELFPGDKIEPAMEKLFSVVDKNVPAQYRKSWIGAAKVYQESSMTMILLFCLALVFIYAILSMQFENFMDPLIILLTVPLALSGALFTVWIFNQSLNIYTQVGLITLIGLITKHGILIVEFTNQLQKSGIPLLEAIKTASKLRLRPILMTTGAMIFGAIPLVLSQDAGSEARQAIGWTLLGGLSFGTFFTLFVLPALCLSIKSRFKKRVEAL